MDVVTGQSTPLRAWLRRLIVCLALGVTGWGGSAMAAITVGPDADPNCQFHHVGSAIAAAVQQPGLDLVQISTGTYMGVTNLSVTGSDELIIEGGFANCSAGLSTGVSTLDGAGAAQPGSIINHFGAGKLRLLHLILTHGDSGGGGGINSQGSGELVLSDVGLFSNHAAYGGGLYVSGGIGAPKQVGLFGVNINSNVADGSGGGMYAAYANVSIDGERLSYFLGNQAQGEAADSGDGGAIYAFNSNIDIRSASVTYPFIGSNHALRNGGGIYFFINDFGPVSPRLILENNLTDQPLLISDNSAETGGALYVKAKSATPQFLYAHLANTRIEGNTALYAAAIYSEAEAIDTDPVNTLFIMSRSDAEYTWSAAPPCTPAVACNTISGNHALGDGVVHAYADGAAATSEFAILGGQIRDNLVNNGTLIFGFESDVHIETSLLVDNQSSALVAVIGSDLRIANSTVANNELSAAYLFNVFLMPASLSITNSMLHSADLVDAYSVGASVPVTVRNIGSSGVSVTGSNVQTLPEPFVDSANGDYHLEITSSAVDRWARDPVEYLPGIDLDGAARPYIFNSATTPYDFGAYEAGAVIERVFRNGFEQAGGGPG